jgi:hypothetical protein
MKNGYLLRTKGKKAKNLSFEASAYTQRLQRLIQDRKEFRKVKRECNRIKKKLITYQQIVRNNPASYNSIELRRD